MAFEDKQVVHLNNIPWHMPQEMIDEIVAWEIKCKSPFSHSYYNVRAGEKTWDDTPLGSLRISDHWNFKANGKVHCPTDRPVANNARWTLAQWDGEQYVVLRSLYRLKIYEVSDERARLMQPSLQKQRLDALAKSRLTAKPESATELA
jgi:hypothetical protein